MLSRLEGMVEAKALLPFVLLCYVQLSTYSWHDDSGERWTVTQAEGECDFCTTLAEALSTVAGIRLHQGKTRVWNTIGQCPEDIADS